MDIDRPSISRSGERPVTRWRREPESSENIQAYSEHSNSEISRPYSKMERPISRRGIKTDITEYGISRPPTSGRNSFSRPPSPSILSNRLPTAVSRVATPGSAMSRINSGLPRNFGQPNAMIHDRPITQQGLVGVGVRPNSSKPHPMLTRQMQDKIYYKQLLQHKIQELNQEISSIAHQVEIKNIETPYRRGRNIKNFGTEMIELQHHLDNYNNGTDKISDFDKNEVEQEARTLKEINDNIENILQKQKEAKNKLNELDKEIEFKQKIAEKFADSMDAETKSKYDEAYKEKIQLQNTVDDLQDEYEQLLKRQTLQKEKIALSPIKQEIYKVYNKMVEDKQKRDKVLNLEDKNDETDEENLDITVAKKQINEIEKKIADAQLELEQLELDGDDNQGEYTEMLKNENSIEELMAKLNYLEEQVVNRLEKISSSINENVDRNNLKAEDMELLKTLMEQNFDDKNKKSFDELKEDYIKLYQASRKLENLELKIKKNKNEAVQNQTETIDGLEFYDERPKTLISRKQLLDENIYKKEETTKHNYSELKEKIEKNEVYRFISILEDKLQKFSSDNNQHEKTIENKTDEMDNSALIETLMNLTTQYNSILINNMKTVF